MCKKKQPQINILKEERESMVTIQKKNGFIQNGKTGKFKVIIMLHMSQNGPLILI